MPVEGRSIGKIALAGETEEMTQNIPTYLTTELARIAYLSERDRDMVFKQLMHHINKDALQKCFDKLDRKAASGSDGITKDQYGQNLNGNLHTLVTRMKRMSYRPSSVREVLIPKEGKVGATRPLGISNLEDKIVQRMFQQVLSAIYEPLFLDCSYGFRPGRSCHDAIKALRAHLYWSPVQVVIDVDLANFFGTIDHQVLLDILGQKIHDQRFLRYVQRMFRAGVLSEGELRMSDEGVPQGSICSPVLANIVAHHVIDQWFENTVKHHCHSEVKLFRYADDLCICCNNAHDAKRIKKALEKRLERFNLKLNREKTHSVIFNRQLPCQSSGAFEFLGFTFYMGKSLRGRPLPKLKSSGKRIRSKLKRVSEWAKKIRNRLPLKEIWHRFCAKLRGHVQYYGVSFNTKRVECFLWRATKIMFKWLNRRSQKKSFTWDSFMAFLQAYPRPAARVVHSLI
jgi:group II intron reverse transcriptase/maturase